MVYKTTIKFKHFSLKNHKKIAKIASKDPFGSGFGTQLKHKVRKKQQQQH